MSLMLALMADVAMATPPAPQPATPDAQSIKTMYMFAACAANRMPTRAKALLALDPAADDTRAAVQGFSIDASDGRSGGGGCLNPGLLRFNSVYLFGALGELRVRSRVKPADAAGAVAYDPSRPAIKARNDGEVIALCTVRTAPAQTWALFATPVASDAERVAFKALTPAIGQCVAAGVNVKMNRPGLRALLGYAAYRLVEANAAPVKTAG